MRVLMTTDTVGGVWTFTQELTAGLMERGWTVSLVSIGRKPSVEQALWASATAKRWSGFEFESAEAPLEWMQENTSAFSDVEPLLQRRLREFKPDVFHANQFCFGALRTNVPKLVTAHSDVLSWAAACRETPLEDSAWLRQYQRLVSAGLAGADAVVAPTRWMLEALSRHFTIPVHCQVIPNGREIVQPESEPRKLQAVTAGRLWDGAKNVTMLRDVVSPMPLLVAGETESEGAAAPARLGEARLVGALPQDALLRLFAQSAIYVCTSCYEPFGLAPLEAALCGCAVLAHDIPSLREVWGDGALYFEDVTALSRLLQELASDGALLGAAQARSLERAKTFARDAMSAAYADLFASLAGFQEELSHVA